MRPNKKIAEMADVCIKVLKVNGKTRTSFRCVCMGLVVDKDCKYWILEIQVNYAAEIKVTRDEGE